MKRRKKRAVMSYRKLPLSVVEKPSHNTNYPRVAKNLLFKKVKRSDPKKRFFFLIIEDMLDIVRTTKEEAAMGEDKEEEARAAGLRRVVFRVF